MAHLCTHTQRLGLAEGIVDMSALRDHRTLWQHGKGYMPLSFVVKQKCRHQFFPLLIDIR